MLSDTSGKWHRYEAELSGSTSASSAASAFWLPHYSGTYGNRHLDKDSISLWRLEVSIDDEGGVGSGSSGVIEVSDLRCSGDNLTLIEATLGGHNGTSPGIESGDEKCAATASAIAPVGISIGSKWEVEGVARIEYIVPERAYINVTGASVVQMRYKVVSPQPSANATLWLALGYVNQSSGSSHILRRSLGRVLANSTGWQSTELSIELPEESTHHVDSVAIELVGTFPGLALRVLGPFSENMTLLPPPDAISNCSANSPTIVVA